MFVSGTHGYDTYRIPALVVTAKGTLLAFCEGRKTSRSDTGDIDTLLRRSTDGGKTWSGIQVVSDFGGDVAGNPWESSVLGYHLARQYTERYNHRYGTGLIPKSAPMVEDIAEFWGRHFLGRAWRKRLATVQKV